MAASQRQRSVHSGPCREPLGRAVAGVAGRASVFRMERTAWAVLERPAGQDPGRRACFGRGAVAVRLAGGVGGVIRPHRRGLEGPGSSWAGS